ncbi:hypothetical protein M9Y10_038753 [Tritrichomonas musculus]|uniref:Uncharacterized protein n=1 Tax=Tritrichomonas musculus TaxID=1915356 RepID=A0ABR2K9A1_9EUKA
MSSDEQDQPDEESELIVIPFKAELGEIINAKNLLINAGVIDDNSSKKRQSSVLEKLESKIGKIVNGYDDGKDFIDDSEIILNNNENVEHELDPKAFRVVLSFGNAVAPAKPVTPSRSKSEDAIQEIIPVSDEMAPYIESIRQVTLAPIREKMEKIHSGNPKDKEFKINLSNEMIEAIGQCVDAKVKIETEKLEVPPSKKKLDTWKSDICKQIFQTCFTTNGYNFVKSTRVIQNAYNKYLKGKEPKPDAPTENVQHNDQDDSNQSIEKVPDEALKELPVIPNQQ